MHKSIKASFVKQTNQSWCGLACLSMICKYYGGDMPQTQLVKISGTSITGTTLLGLYQAANIIGLKAEGLEGAIEELKQFSHPAILHCSTETGLEHYVTCFGYENEHFIIGDPAKEILEMSVSELEKIWKSRKLLLIQKGDSFQSVNEAKERKRMWIKSLLRPDMKVLLAIAGFGVFISAIGLSLAVFSQK